VGVDVDAAGRTYCPGVDDPVAGMSRDEPIVVIFSPSMKTSPAY
jgi:hypothetical protein